MAHSATGTTPQASASARRSTCWGCGAAVGLEHFCPACGKIQAQAADQDYFDFFGLSRKLAIDARQLEQHFHQLSWKLHPDNFSTASPRERELSLEKAAVLNDAYRTLREPIARVQYLLGLEGVRREGEIKQQAPPDLLEEVFELNEYLEELRATRRAGGDARELGALRERLETARQQFQARQSRVEEELFAHFHEWDVLLDAGADAAARRPKLEEMSALLNRHSYIRNLVRNVQEELEE